MFHIHSFIEFFFHCDTLNNNDDDDDEVSPWKKTYKNNVSQLNY